MMSQFLSIHKFSSTYCIKNCPVNCPPVDRREQDVCSILSSFIAWVCITLAGGERITPMMDIFPFPVQVVQ